MSALGMQEILDALARSRENDVDDVWLKPGKPFAFERMGDTVVDHERIVSPEGFRSFFESLLKDDDFNRKRLDRGIFRDFVLPNDTRNRGSDLDSQVRFSREIERIGRIRVKPYGVDGKPALSIRLLREKAFTMPEQDLPQVVEELAYLPSGVIVIVGPTGHGKTSLTASMTDARHARIPGHTMIIGDPIEYRHESRTSTIDHQEIGTDYRSIDDAFATILSARAHVIVPPEMFTARQIQDVVALGETDHVVFAQMHAGDTTEALLRMVAAVSLEGDNGRARLAQSLAAIVALRLVKRSNVRDGQVARRAIVEVLVNTDKVKSIIRDPRRAPELADTIHQGGEYGMMRFEQHVKLLVGKQIDAGTKIFTDSSAFLRSRLNEGGARRVGSAR
jgi:twitching motility protein PilT